MGASLLAVAKYIYLLNSPNGHPQLKKIKEWRRISTVNDVLRDSLNTDYLGWILTLQVRQKAKKKHQTREVHVCWQNETRKIIDIWTTFVREIKIRVYGKRQIQVENFSE